MMRRYSSWYTVINAKSNKAFGLRFWFDLRFWRVGKTVDGGKTTYDCLFFTIYTGSNLSWWT